VFSESNPSGDYLQLRKDAMRIPKQFYFRVKAQEKHEDDNMKNYFSFNA